MKQDTSMKQDDSTKHNDSMKYDGNMEHDGNRALDLDLKRWDGWGHADVDLAVPMGGWALLRQKLGEATFLESPTFEQVLQEVPASRFQGSRLEVLSYVDLDAETRLRHTRGRGFADWLAVKSGQLQSFPSGVAFPDAVAFPKSSEQVQTLLQLAQSEDFMIIPYGGGTSVAGDINPQSCAKPVMTVSLARMNRLLDFDEQTRVATFGAGVYGPQLEAQLRPLGYTLGHYPQSFEYSTAGGWVASRSKGQQSLGYGRIEQLFLGGRVETLYGSLRVPVVPDSATAPSLREQVLGSEGRLGIITEVQFKVVPLPEVEAFYPLFFPNWQQGLQAAKMLSQSDLALSMVHLNLPEQTRMQLALTRSEQGADWLERFLKLRGVDESKCLMILGVTGTRATVRRTWVNARSLLKPFEAVKAPQALGTDWSEQRFDFPYLREKIWQAGYGIDTLETVVTWPKVEPLITQLEAALHQAAKQLQHCLHVVTYLSDVYPQGSGVYTTFLFPVGEDYQTGYERWLNLKRAAAEVIAEQGDAISHRRDEGNGSAGSFGAESLERRAVAHRLRWFDPDERLNPVKSLSSDDEVRV